MDSDILVNLLFLNKGTLLGIILLLTLGTEDGMYFVMSEISDIGPSKIINSFIFVDITMATL